MTVLCLISLVATSGCIFAGDSNNENNTNNENNENNTKDMQSGDMTKMDMSNPSDMTEDIPNPADATADTTEPSDMGPDINPPEDMEPDLDPPTGDALYVFLTSTRVDLSNGLSDADKACNADNTKPRDGKYMAMLGHSDRRPCFGAMECLEKPEGINWVFQPNQLYQRYDTDVDVAVPVFKTTDKAKFSTMLDQVKLGPGINFATGFNGTDNDTWRVVAPQARPAECINGCRTTCDGWTKTVDIGQQMAVGWTAEKTAAAFLNGGSQNCGRNYVLCVEQPSRPATGN